MTEDQRAAEIIRRLRDFVAKWEQGYKVVIGVKQGTRDSWLMAKTRRFYYWLVTTLSNDIALIRNFTGFRRGTDVWYYGECHPDVATAFGVAGSHFGEVQDMQHPQGFTLGQQRQT